MSIGSLEILEMGYGENGEEMIIQLTSNLLMHVILNASQSTYTAYGGDDQFISDLSISLNINKSSLAIKNSGEQ
jgi:hypothetical protein